MAEQPQEQAAPAPTPEERISAMLSPEEPPAPAEQPEAEPAPAEPEEQAEAPVEAEAPAEPEAAPAEEEEAIELSSFSDLTEYLGVAPEDVYNLSIPVNVNGKPVEMTLSEVKDSLQHAEEAKRFQEEAKQLREHVEQQKKQAQEEYQLQMAQGSALVQQLEQQALARFQGLDLDKLRAENPAEWAAKMTEIQQVRGTLDQAKQAVAQQLQQYKQQQSEQQEAAFQAHVQSELEALYQKWPEMADESKGKAEKAALVDELKSRGFSESEINSASDHRILLLARDAMRYRQSVQGADAAKKKVVKLAKKVVRPGAKQSKQEQNSERLRPLRDRLKKSGDWQDAAALISQLNRS